MDYALKSEHGMFEASGYSMWPSVREKDRLLVLPADIRTLKPGDLVVYQQGDRSVCHRFVRFGDSNNAEVLVTRQDYSASRSTEQVPRSCYRGKVSAVIRGTKIIRTDSRAYALLSRLLLWGAPFFSFCVDTLKRVRRH